MDRNWCLKLDKSKSMLIAVDSRTGKEIAPLIGFSKTGIRSYVGAEKELIDSGYDPYEHEDTYDEFGGICIKEEIAVQQDNNNLVQNNLGISIINYEEKL